MSEVERSYWLWFQHVNVVKSCNSVRLLTSVFHWKNDNKTKKKRRNEKRCEEMHRGASKEKKTKNEWNIWVHLERRYHCSHIKYPIKSKVIPIQYLFLAFVFAFLFQALAQTHLHICKWIQRYASLFYFFCLLLFLRFLWHYCVRAHNQFLTLLRQHTTFKHEIQNK